MDIVSQELVHKVKKNNIHKEKSFRLLGKCGSFLCLGSSVSS